MMTCGGDRREREVMEELVEKGALAKEGEEQTTKHTGEEIILKQVDEGKIK